MIEALGVVVPAHDEQDLLPRCLAALDTAVCAVARRPGAPRVHVVVALDACTDASGEIATRARVRVVRLDARNVGCARAAGMAAILELETTTVTDRIWVCTTDADSVVPSHWLTRQLELAEDGALAVVGTVEADEWDSHGPDVAALWAARYQRGEPHAHVHGANLGCNAAAYLAAGGFSPLRTGEDVALLGALNENRVRRVTDPVVRTSTRWHSRAPHGFGTYLRELGSHDTG